MNSKDFFMSRKQLEDSLFDLNKSIEENILEKEKLLSRISILDYVMARDEKKVKEIKERLSHE